MQLLIGTVVLAVVAAIGMADRDRSRGAFGSFPAKYVRGEGPKFLFEVKNGKKHFDVPADVVDKVADIEHKEANEHEVKSMANLYQEQNHHKKEKKAHKKGDHKEEVYQYLSEASDHYKGTRQDKMIKQHADREAYLHQIAGELRQLNRCGQYLRVLLSHMPCFMFAPKSFVSQLMQANFNIYNPTHCHALKDHVTAYMISEMKDCNVVENEIFRGIQKDPVWTFGMMIDTIKQFIVDHLDYFVDHFTNSPEFQKIKNSSFD